MNDFENDYLIHHGIKGQKWGVRRYQNEDGTLSSAGKIRANKYGNIVDSSNSLFSKTRKPKTEMEKEVAKDAIRKDLDKDKKNYKGWTNSMLIGVGTIALGSAAYLAAKNKGDYYTNLALAASGATIIGAGVGNSVKRSIQKNRLEKLTPKNKRKGGTI